MKKMVIELKKQRDSNLELLRIIMMLIIVAHHYTVHSPVIRYAKQNLINFAVAGGQCNGLWDSLFALIFGWGGKMAINVFILISGFFMCKQDFKWKKVFFLCLQVEFYALAMYTIFSVTGYSVFSIKELFRTIFCIPYDISKGFIGSFIAFYCLIPFINKFISTLDKRTFQKFMVTFFVIFSILPTLLLNSTFEYISWYIFVYLIGSYIRLYPIEYLEKPKQATKLVWTSLLLSWLSIVGVFLLQCALKRQLPYYSFVNDSNKILAIVPAVLIFYSFKNWKIGTNKLINLLGGSTFGVLLIHDSSYAMHKWLWHDICQNGVWFQSRYFVIHALLSVLCVFIICSIIDIFRKKVCNLLMGEFSRQKLNGRTENSSNPPVASRFTRV